MNNKCCGSCDKTNNVIYCSMPPKVKCSITDEYHQLYDRCNVEVENRIYILESIENGKMKRITECCNSDVTSLTASFTPKYCIECGKKLSGIKKVY